MSPKSTLCQRRIGAVAVEFALVAPVFFLLILAGIEFGRINMIWGTIGNASYEGVRRAIIPGAEPEDAVAAARVLLDTALIRGATITVDPPEFGDETTDITVTIAVDMNQNSWLSYASYSDGLHVSKSRTLARELYATDIVADVLLPPGGGGDTGGGDTSGGDTGDGDTGGGDTGGGDTGGGDTGGGDTGGGGGGGGGGWWWWGHWGWW